MADWKRMRQVFCRMRQDMEIAEWCAGNLCQRERLEDVSRLTDALSRIAGVARGAEFARIADGLKAAYPEFWQPAEEVESFYRDFYDGDDDVDWYSLFDEDGKEE